MIATQVRQKDAVFYFVSYPARDVLDKVKFMRRFYGEGAPLDAQPLDADDEIAKFVAHIEGSDKAFQRELSQRKVRAIMNFYETTNTQPPIPGSVLLFTPERLHFKPVGEFSNVGNLDGPKEKFLIIDGQHRLAALYFYLRAHPEEDRSRHVPCVIFDGKSEDFATEMFVVINSTPTRINKSHLIDLYEKVTYGTDPHKKVAAQVLAMAYGNDDSPLKYRINRLGGKSGQEKWILQAELFNEIHRWLIRNWKEIPDMRTGRSIAGECYEMLHDFIRAAQRVWGETWDNKNYMVTRPVTLKAMIRVCCDLARSDPGSDGRIGRWERTLSPWKQVHREFRSEGFYERFAAKGQVERVRSIHTYLDKLIGLSSHVEKTDAEE
jgi:DGQHR domain-containing protein